MKKNNVIAILGGVAIATVVVTVILSAIHLSNKFNEENKRVCVDERTISNVEYDVSGINIDNYYIQYTDGSAESFNRYSGETPVVGNKMCLAKGWIKR